MGDQLEGEIDSASPAATTEQPAEERPPLEVVLGDLDSRLAEAQRLLGRQTELTERLHSENQELRAGELRNAQLPLVRDLMRLCDNLERMLAVADSSGDDLTLAHEGLLDILDRNGIQSFGAERGERFDPRLHTAAGVDPTDDEQLDKTVAEVVRQGFRWDNGEVIRVAEVRAYRFGGSN